MASSAASVEFQVFGETLTDSHGTHGEWVTVSTHRRDEMSQVESQRTYYPASQLQMRWVQRMGGKKPSFRVITV